MQEIDNPAEAKRSGRSARKDRPHRFAATIKSCTALLALFSLVFVLAGRLDYWQGWLFGAINALILTLLLLLIPDLPVLIKERARPGPATKWWDRLFWLLFGPMNLAVIVIASLDGGRYHWTGRLPFIIYALAFLVYILASVLHFWAIRANAFYSSTVSIQSQTGQKVVDDGPYGYVRHPGYAGIMGMMGSIPLLLGSLYGLVPAAGVVLLVVIRTVLEDLALKNELPGYVEYARRVRFRIVPGLW